MAEQQSSAAPTAPIIEAAAADLAPSANGGTWSHLFDESFLVAVADVYGRLHHRWPGETFLSPNHTY